MGLQPTKLMKIAFRPTTTLHGSVTSPWSSRNPNNRSQMEAPPSPCHPEEPRDLQCYGLFGEMFFCFPTELSWAFGPPTVMKSDLRPATTLHGSVTFPLVISQSQ
jgi:hypothetical protein